MNQGYAATAMSLPILLGLSFNASATAGDYEAYLDRLNSWEERFGSPVEVKRYKPNGSYDTRQVFFLDSGRGHHIEFDENFPEKYYTGHLVPYGLEEGELFAYHHEDMLNIKMDEGVACTSDENTSIAAEFSLSVSAQDLSDLAISPEAANDLYRHVFFQALQEQVLIFEQPLQPGDSHDARSDQMSSAFERALEVARETMERDYAITLSKREPISFTRVRTISGLTLNDCQNRRRVP